MSGLGIIQTRKGLKFPLLKPVPGLIDVRDVAAHLAKLCRFTGACTSLYTVAQHAVLVSQLVPEEHARWGLLHDAAEAYLGDLSAPLKGALEERAPGVLKGIEDGLLRAVADRYGLPWPMPKAVHHADKVALATERRDLMVPVSWPWPGELPPPAPTPIVPWSPPQAEAAFLLRFVQLWGHEA